LFSAVLLAALTLPQAAGASITGIPKINPHPSFTPALPAAPTATSTGRAALNPFAPVTGTSWAGISDPTVSPPDPNGAIGPSSYMEIINLQAALYNRSGTVLSTTPLGLLTGHSQFNLSDPMVLWDPQTQRFYYNVWDVSNATMAWGFSKTTAPATFTTADWCNYTSTFGYSSSDVPDYPKLGQTKGFLLIGVNHYAGFSAPSSDRSDLLWIDKPQTVGTITTCPAASTFLSGKFTNLRNQDGTQAFTPVPAIEDDNVSNGYVVASNDIECPPICGSGHLITVYTIRPSTTNAQIPVIYNTNSITVPAYSSPTTNAPQLGSSNVLDTLDGRLEHAVAAVDPSVGHIVIWTGHTIDSGSGGRTLFRWYEISPIPIGSASVVQSGTVSSAEMWIFNGAMAPDRVVTPTGSAFGSNVVIGFSMSNTKVDPMDVMVSKVGSNPQSGFVIVHRSTSPDNDFTCSPCRWGDYGGATSDPAASLTGTSGQVWLTNEAVTSGNNTTWNWEATP
jgi:hypothetical protein